MLKNPVYTGQAAFGKSKRVKRRGKNKHKVSICRIDKDSWIYIPVPKIVDEGLFNKVQNQLDENRKRARIQREGSIHLTTDQYLYFHSWVRYWRRLSTSSFQITLAATN